MASAATRTTSELAAISRLFSAAVLRELAARGRSARFARLASLSGLGVQQGELVGDYFDRAFHALAAPAARDEFVYKSAVLRRVLLGRHSLNTATAVTEFRVGEARADLAVFNGTSTAYEVKSERDNLDRLDEQVMAYSNFFDHVVVVASPRHVRKLEASLPPHVGITTLSARQHLSTVRAPWSNRPQVLPRVVCEAVRRDEALAILRANGIAAPSLPNTQIGRWAREQFELLAPEDIHDTMVSVLRKTRSLAARAPILATLPSSLWGPGLSMNLAQRDWSYLSSAMRIQMTSAMEWC